MVYIVDWGVIRENFKERERLAHHEQASRGFGNLRVREIRIHYQSAVAPAAGMK